MDNVVLGRAGSCWVVLASFALFSTAFMLIHACPFNASRGTVPLPVLHMTMSTPHTQFKGSIFASHRIGMIYARQSTSE
eukprot:2618654-Rhodomonas_salina.1